MSDIVLHGVLVSLSSPEGRAFITDACRAGENLLTDRELAQIYELTAQELETLASNRAVGDAIRRERAARVRSGQAAREAAQQHFVQAPKVLNELMTDKTTHPKFRIESARELRTVALDDGKTETTGNTDKFVITINLGDDHIERFEKDITPKQLPAANDWGWREVDNE